MKTIKHILIDIADNAYIAGLKRDKDSIFNLDQALKELEELLLECKPEKKKLYEAPNGSVESALIGYNSGLDDYEKNIKELL